MFATTVEFNVDAPVAGVGSEVSLPLEALVARWRADRAVSSVAVEWKALPRAGESLIGAADLRVGLHAETRELLRTAYDRLTRQVVRARPLRLAGRSCSLTDLYE